ncbi:hypothetical protein ACP275_09G129400 [Erythranthe tilingii]
MQGIDALGVNENNATPTGIDKLPDEMLIAILSCLSSVKDAVRTSVLSTRWRYLWMFISGKLEFDDRELIGFPGRGDSATVKRKKFKSWVNHVLNLHQGSAVDSLVIRFTNLRLRARSSHIDNWIHFAVKKKVQKFELNLSVPNGFHCCYKFPTIDKLFKSYVFGSLRSLRLVDVDIEDDVVRSLLVLCPSIEYLCIRASNATKNLEVVDPLPNLKELEISDCHNLESMKIYAMSLVSCTYQGREIGLPFKRTPNLTELTLGEEFFQSFMFEPNKHSSYSVQLVKLVLNLKSVRRERANVSLDLPQLYSLKWLELNTVTEFGQMLFFFMSLIKASPNLQEFKMKIVYLIDHHSLGGRYRSTPSIVKMPFPSVTASTTNGFHHKNLKLIEVVGFIGSRKEFEFLTELFKVAPLLDTVLFNTQSDSCYPLVDFVAEREEIKPMEYDSFYSELARYWAMEVKKHVPPQIKFVIT